LFQPDEIEKGSPIILLHFMVQQINCVKSKKDGAVVEGSEDDIRANSYVAAFQREYNAERGELNWKIVDFRFNGAIAYL
jgi:mitochondrial import inner membrane translocase subunit TIM44